MPSPKMVKRCVWCARKWLASSAKVETCSPLCRARLRESRGVAPRSLPRQYPAGIVVLVRHLYAIKGLTVAEVQRAIPGGFKVQLILERYEIPRRPLGKREQRGASNASWRGDHAGYAACHLRVVEQRGKPTECEWCGDGASRMEWANLTGRYADVWDYARLCQPCHRTYDASRRRATGEPTIPARLRRGVVPNV